jgi:hypothetical protein
MRWQTHDWPVPKAANPYVSFAASILSSKGIVVTYNITEALAELQVTTDHLPYDV